MGIGLRALGLAVGGALFWLVYFNLKDHLRPEPRRLLLAAFALGNLSAVVALGGFRLAELLGAPAWPGAGEAAILVYCLGLVGPLEEGAKFLVARLTVYRSRDFDEPIDGIVYAATVAIGFATVENLLFATYLGAGEQVARSLASPLTHSLFAAVWGFGIARARFDARSAVGRLTWQGGTLVSAMALHGLYDFVLLAWGAAYLAGGIALVLWLALIAHARAVVRRPGHRVRPRKGPEPDTAASR